MFSKAPTDRSFCPQREGEGMSCCGPARGGGLYPVLILPGVGGTLTS